MRSSIRHARASAALALLLAVVACAIFSPIPARAAGAPADTSAVGQIRADAVKARATVKSKLALAFLDATATALPHVAPRTVSYDSSRTHYYWEPEAAALPDSVRSKLITRTLDESFFYNTRYGSPLAYSRPLELLAEAGLGDLAGAKLADYGYGTIGHLRLLASLGADVVGVDVDPLLQKLYSVPGDQGAVRGAGGREGRVTLAHGSFPGDTAVANRVGRGLTLFLSKNTLKNGYIHPAQPVNPRMLVHLGVSDSAYVAALARAVAPGGWVMIYNLSPAPNAPDQPYRPWADGRCPFPRAMFEAAGFEVLAFDRDDTPAAHAMARALGWDQGPSPMDLAKDLFAAYTLARRKAR